MRSEKTLSLVVAVVLAALSVFGGGASAAPTGGAVSSEGTEVLQFWPLHDGNRWRFGGFGTEIELVAVELGPDQWRVDGYSNGFVVQREYFQLQDGDLVIVRREQTTGTAVFDPPQLFLKTPFEAGQEWTWTGELDGELVAMTYIVMEPETVETPAGTFEAFPVALTIRSSSDGVNMMRWFAPGIGIVREQAGLSVAGQPFLVELLLVEYDVN